MDPVVQHVLGKSVNKSEGGHLISAINKQVLAHLGSDRSKIREVLNKKTVLGVLRPPTNCFI